MAAHEPSLHHEVLLLLTGTSSISFDSLKAAYGAALSTILSTHSTSVKGTGRSIVLDIAITTRGVCVQPRSKSFAHLQRLLATFYKLLGAISSSLSVELDGPGGVDARVFFLDYDPINPPASPDHQQSTPPQYGPIIDLRIIVTSNRSWDVIYALDTEENHVLTRELSDMFKQRSSSNSHVDIRKLPGSGGIQLPNLFTDDNEITNKSSYYSVAVGGTFDHLHAGHKLLLTATALALDPGTHSSSRRRRILTVGITGDELLVNKKYAEFLESWEERWRGVWTFLRSIMEFSSPDQRDIRIDRQSNPGPNGKRVVVSVAPDLELRFVQISDPFGPTITDKDITALVVSKETRSGGKAVNDEREKKGWDTLDVFEVDVLESGGEDVAREENTGTEDFGAKISSTEIRRRQMNLAKGSL